jgi:hypothetical protein
MMHLVLPYVQGRPIVEVRLGIGRYHNLALTQTGKPIPAPARLQFLADTGAEVTFIDQAAARRLGLRRTGVAPVNTGSSGTTPVQFDEYEVALDIPDPATKASAFRDLSMTVLGADLAAQHLDGILGRDVLDQAIATFHGPKQSLILDL